MLRVGWQCCYECAGDAEYQGGRECKESCVLADTIWFERACHGVAIVERIRFNADINFLYITMVPMDI